MKDSKKISNTDESSKKLIMEVLENDVTHGFDLDSIYYKNGKWILFEFLKCDHISTTPTTSTPHKYPNNWRKFHVLYQLKKKLDGDLLLVNYSDRDHDKDLIKIMKVNGLDYDLLKANMNKENNVHAKYLEYLDLEEYEINKDEFKNWFKNLNKNADIPELE